jgi:cytoskeletal protein CcmA (bactofilin family)
MAGEMWNIEMWNKRRPEEITATPVPEGTLAPPTARRLESGKDAPLVSKGFMVETKPYSPVDAVTIGKTVKVVGQIHSEEDLFVDGDLEGTIEAITHKLTIGPTGDVHASVKAHDVVVLGALEGNVEVADRIEIGREAKVVGDIRTARIHIEDGAYFKGSIDIVKPEPLRTQTNSKAVVLATVPNREGIAVGKQSE